MEPRRRPRLGANVAPIRMTSKLTFIDTNKLPRVKTPQGEFTEILNQQLAGAKNVLGTLRWLSPSERFEANPLEKHQLIYLMEGSGKIHLDNQDYDVSRGAGVYLGPSETAIIQAGGASSLKLFHLVVPRIPA